MINEKVKNNNRKKRGNEVLLSRFCLMVRVMQGTRFKILDYHTRSESVLSKPALFNDLLD